MPQYWLVALPVGKQRSKQAVWDSLQDATAAARFSVNHKLEMPELRVGTLDTLMALSDDLSKSNNMIEAVVNKLKRQVHETGGPAAVAGLKVEGLPSEVYLTRFKWDEAKFPSRRPLKETVEKIMEIVARVEDDLKVKVSEFNQLKAQLGAIARKQTGSLAVRDISTMVKPSQLIDSENLTTLFVIVSKFGLQEWEATYEKLSNFVVPRSSRVITEDSDYALVSVVLFKRVVDEFKGIARQKGYQVREYSAPAEEAQAGGAALETLKRDVDAKKGALEAWCKTAYGEAFSAWIHIAAVRIFVEAILRYGLPGTGQSTSGFQAAVLAPADKMETRLREVLANRFGDGKSSVWKNEEGASIGAGLAGDSEMYPYVSFTVNVAEVA